jgi:hypothetical protein
MLAPPPPRYICSTQYTIFWDQSPLAQPYPASLLGGIPGTVLLDWDEKSTGGGGGGGRLKLSNLCHHERCIESMPIFNIGILGSMQVHFKKWKSIQNGKYMVGGTNASVTLLNDLNTDIFHSVMSSWPCLRRTMHICRGLLFKLMYNKDDRPSFKHLFVSRQKRGNNSRQEMRNRFKSFCESIQGNIKLRPIKMHFLQLDM